MKAPATSLAFSASPSASQLEEPEAAYGSLAHRRVPHRLRLEMQNSQRLAHVAFRGTFESDRATRRATCVRAWTRERSDGSDPNDLLRTRSGLDSTLIQINQVGPCDAVSGRYKNTRARNARMSKLRCQGPRTYRQAQRACKVTVSAMLDMQLNRPRKQHPCASTAPKQLQCGRPLLVDA